MTVQPNLYKEKILWLSAIKICNKQKLFDYYLTIEDDYLNDDRFSPILPKNHFLQEYKLPTNVFIPPLLSSN